MSTPLKSARSIKQKLLSSKKIIRSILSYSTQRKEDQVCSDKELNAKIKQVDRDIASILDLLSKLESNQRRSMREDILKGRT